MRETCCVPVLSIVEGLREDFTFYELSNTSSAHFDHFVSGINTALKMPGLRLTMSTKACSTSVSA